LLPTTDVTQHAGATLATVTGDVDAFTVEHVSSVRVELQLDPDTVVILDLRPVTGTARARPGPRPGRARRTRAGWWRWRG